jgi:hypothetical protein
MAAFITTTCIKFASVLPLILPSFTCKKKKIEVRTGKSITPQKNKNRGIMAQVSYFIACCLPTEFFDEIRSRDMKNIVFQDWCGFIAVA